MSERKVVLEGVAYAETGEVTVEKIVAVQNVGKIINALKPHVVITAGGGVHGHPDGSAAGATSMMQAKEAALQGIIEEDDLVKWAHENDKKELSLALGNVGEGYSR